MNIFNIGAISTIVASTSMNTMRRHNNINWNTATTKRNNTQSSSNMDDFDDDEMNEEYLDDEDIIKDSMYRNNEIKWTDIEYLIPKQLKKDVLEKANAFRAEHWDSSVQAPSNLRNIIKKFGGDIHYFDIDREERPLMTFFNKNEFIMFDYISAHGYNYLNMAKCLGHLILHLNDNVFEKYSNFSIPWRTDISNYINYEAYWFSHELLLPNKIFYEDMLQLENSSFIKIVAYFNRKYDIPSSLCERKVRDYFDDKRVQFIKNLASKKPE